jgi:hypothetical protein
MKIDEITKSVEQEKRLEELKKAWQALIDHCEEGETK